MNLKDKLNEYLDGKTDAISVIRLISGVFNPDHAVHILALICSITRYEQKDIDKKTFKKVWGLE